MSTKNSVNKVKNKAKTFFSDFKKFATKGNILDLAIAVVIGGAFGKIVSSLVKDIITPITGLFINTGDLANLKWILKPAVPANEAAGIAAIPEVALTYGIFLQNTIDFLVIALVVFLMLRLVVSFKAKLEHKAVEQAKAAELAEEEKKKQAAADAAAVAELEESVKKKYYENIEAQSAILAEIRDIMLNLGNKQ